MSITALSEAYRSGEATPQQVLAEIFNRIEAAGERPVWITLAPRDRVAGQIARNERRKADGAVLPLYGIPFAVKDNIDVAGLPTTAACPDFAYVPARSATVVEKLEEAGAILVGKTNMDQFATGLVGTRSPYGICSSVFNSDYISGGSSAGSAVAVASGLVSFSLGTDTAGSGRVPAAFNNIVGLKPTKGLISTRGVVPACRSQDCVSIFASNVSDAQRAFFVAQGHDAEDPYSRPQLKSFDFNIPKAFRFGVPAQPLEFFGDSAAAALYAQAVDRLGGLGGVATPIDFAPFREAAKLLYGGPWVAERRAALDAYGFDKFDAMDPTVREIILGGDRVTAVETFEAFYKLAALTQAAEAEWRRIDMMLLPTTGTTYRIDEVLADPIRLNSNLGLYTNFVNLMDLCAVAVPAGFRPNGLPFGVTLIGRALEDLKLVLIAERFCGTVPQPSAPPVAPPQKIRIAVVGAHLTGQPLNGQLTDRAARFVRAARTAPGYSFYALSDTSPAKPGLIYDGKGKGLIELEIWELDPAGFGSFVAEIPPPLGIGTITLEDGNKVKGFLCEPYVLTGARDITEFGGWRNWLARDGQ